MPGITYFYAGVGIRGPYLDHGVKNIEREIGDRILLEVPMVDHPVSQILKYTTEIHKNHLSHKTQSVSRDIAWWFQCFVENQNASGVTKLFCFLVHIIIIVITLQVL